MNLMLCLIGEQFKYHKDIVRSILYACVSSRCIALYYIVLHFFPLFRWYDSF